MNRVQWLHQRHQSQSAEGGWILRCCCDINCTAQHNPIGDVPNWGGITTCINEVLYPESVFVHSEHTWIALNNSVVTSE